MCHSRSAMKVGVDSVLLGAWAPLADAARILDVGTGCGLLALMAAQRNSDAWICAVEIEPEAFAEARSNFALSPWSGRLQAVESDFSLFAGLPTNRSRFDFIVSNPPYFDSGVEGSVSPRLLARHQGALSPLVLIDKARECLMPGGRIAMVLPSDVGADLISGCAYLGYSVKKVCAVRGRIDLPARRCLLLLELEGGAASEEECEWSELILEETPGVPTAEHRELCADFYLKF